MFAKNYGIDFPLLSDADGAVSKQYVGVNYDDTTIPGIVIIKKDGTIAYRQVATTKDDRLTSEQLLEAIDRALGTTGPSVAHGYAVYERIQFHADAGGGVRHHDSTGGTGVFSGAVLFPLARPLLVGPWFESTIRSQSANLAVVGRIPLLHDTGAIHVTATAGYDTSSDWDAGLRVGPWVALTPSWALHLDLGGSLRGLHDRAVFATFGLTYLLGPR